MKIEKAIKILVCNRDTALGWRDIHSFYFDDNMNKWNIFFEDDYCSYGERG